MEDMDALSSTPPPEVEQRLGGAAKSCLRAIDLFRFFAEASPAPDSEDEGLFLENFLREVETLMTFEVLVAVPQAVLTEAVKTCWGDGVDGLEELFGNICQLILVLEEQKGRPESMQLTLCQLLGRLHKSSAVLGHSMAGFLSHLKILASSCASNNVLTTLLEVVRGLLITVTEQRRREIRGLSKPERRDMGLSLFDLDELLIWEGLVNSRHEMMSRQIMSLSERIGSDDAVNLQKALWGCMWEIYKLFTASMGRNKFASGTMGQKNRIASQIHAWTQRLAARWHNDRAVNAQLKLLQFAALAEVTHVAAVLKHQDCQDSLPEAVWKQLLEGKDESTLLKLLTIFKTAVEGLEDYAMDITVNLNCVVQTLLFLSEAFSSFSIDSKRWTMLLVCCISHFVKRGIPRIQKEFQKDALELDWECGGIMKNYQVLAIKSLGGAFRTHLDYLEQKSDGSPSESAAVMDTELGMMSILVHCFKDSMDSFKDPREAAHIEGLYYWNMLTCLQSLGWKGKMTFFRKCRPRFQNPSGLAILQLLQQLTEDRFASVLMTIYTGRTATQRHHHLTLHFFAMGLVGEGLLAPADLFVGLEYFSRELKGLHLAHARGARTATTAGSGDCPFYDKGWASFVYHLFPMVDSCMAFCKAAKAQGLDKHVVRDALVQLQAVKRMLDSCKAWRDGEVRVYHMEWQGRDLLGLRASISAFVAEIQQPPAGGTRAAISAAASDEFAVSPHAGVKYPHKGERQLRGRHAEKFGGIGESGVQR